MWNAEECGIFLSSRWVSYRCADHLRLLCSPLDAKLPLRQFAATTPTAWKGDYTSLLSHCMPPLN